VHRSRRAGAAAPSATMAGVTDGRRGIPPLALVAFLGALTLGAALLGATEAPSVRPGPAAMWQTFLDRTAAAGTLAFTSVTTTTGAVTSVARSEGVIDFSARNARRVSVVRSPHFPAQWTEEVVLGDVPYERLGIDRAGRPRFAGVWTRLSAFEVAPLPPLAGAPSPQVAAERPLMRRVRSAVLSGVATTEYELSAVSITCVGAAGERTSETTRSFTWIDGDGRIRGFANATDVVLGGFESKVQTLTSFSQFGIPVTISAPAPLAGSAGSSTTAVKPTIPLAGCLVTQG
jgi:hypothetical protein